eukprot:2880040-Karenia_brevis.AAC.1
MTAGQPLNSHTPGSPRGWAGLAWLKPFWLKRLAQASGSSVVHQGTLDLIAFPPALLPSCASSLLLCFAPGRVLTRNTASGVLLVHAGKVVEMQLLRLVSFERKMVLRGMRWSLPAWTSASPTNQTLAHGVVALDAGM